MTPADLKSAREALGLTQKALGERLSVSENTIWRWERGLMPIEHPGMLRLALERLVQVSVSEVPLEPHQWRQKPRQRRHTPMRSE